MSGLGNMALAVVLIVGMNTLGGCVAAPVLIVNEILGRIDAHTASSAKPQEDERQDDQRQSDPRPSETLLQPGKQPAASGKPSP